jgi:hypothetical protein
MNKILGNKWTLLFLAGIVILFIYFTSMLSNEEVEVTTPEEAVTEETMDEATTTDTEVTAEVEETTEDLLFDPKG